MHACLRRRLENSLVYGVLSLRFPASFLGRRTWEAPENHPPCWTEKRIPEGPDSQQGSFRVLHKAPDFLNWEIRCSK